MRDFDLKKYQRRNPAPAADGRQNYRHAVVVPVYNELAAFGAMEYSLRQAMAEVSEDIAVIAVINYPAGADGTESEKLLKLIRSRVFPGVHAIYLPEFSGGVGGARKAGMDAFINMLKAEDMEKSVIFSLDADTIVEKDYFVKLLPEVLKGGAVTVGFSHQAAADPEHQQAIDRYENYLRRYVEKLHYAGSPYAFFTVGSAFAVRCDAYVRAGGMKVRAAGEDFYFLQAAAKVGEVRSLPDKLVHPSSRISTRVPFGTGPAVAALLRGESLNEIPDGAFEVLKKVLQYAADEYLETPEKFLLKLPAAAVEFFLKEHFPASWKKVLGNLPSRPLARTAAFHQWFDGLKTLRFLHFLSGFYEKL